PRAIMESSIRNIVKIDSIKEIPGLITDYYGKLPGKMGLEYDVLPVKHFNFYRTVFPSVTFADASAFILKTRMIKSPWEIEQMEKSAELSLATFNYAKEIIRPGLTEIELSGIIDAFSRKHGHGAQLRIRDYQTEGYTWHILSGKSGGMVGLLDSPASGEGTSAAFPCGAGYKLLDADEPVMIDLATVMNGYHMDETRMFAIGSMPDKALKACRAAIQIHDSVLEKVRPGITTGELFLHAETIAGSLGYNEYFLGPPGYKVSFIGHGVGLELIEQPIIARGKKEQLEPGMVFALEPKMLFPNEFSAGIESVFAVTETGARLLSRVPAEIFIC
ncbi:MAG: Aminopeptidase family protein, partial [Thermodesulfobacteriota bacterium]|nr:Aminopeptidase family protein [Thermodesulfobacteriota bacterium]